MTEGVKRFSAGYYSLFWYVSVERHSSVTKMDPGGNSFGSSNFRRKESYLQCRMEVCEPGDSGESLRTEKCDL